MFFVEKLLGSLLNPLTLALAFAVWAFFYRRRRRLLLCVAVGVLCVFGYPMVPMLLQKPLVTRYAPVTEVRADIVDIVVLDPSGVHADRSLPVNGRASPGFLYRILEGVRLHRQLPESRMLVLVSVPNDVAAARGILDELGRLVGVAADKLVPAVGGLNTRAEARLIRELVGTNAFYLVTSDFHMPRAMMIFEQAGMRPLAAPVGSCGREDVSGTFHAGVLYPRAANLRATDQAVHEYLGMLWAWLVGGKGKEGEIRPRKSAGNARKEGEDGYDDGVG